MRSGDRHTVIVGGAHAGHQAGVSQQLALEDQAGLLVPGEGVGVHTDVAVFPAH